MSDTIPVDLPTPSVPDLLCRVRRIITLLGLALFVIQVGCSLWAPDSIWQEFAGALSVNLYLWSMLGLAFLAWVAVRSIRAWLLLQPVPPPTAAYMLLLGPVYYLSALFVFHWLQIVPPEQLPINEAIQANPLELTVFALFAAVYEEVFFRGIAYTALAKQYGAPVAGSIIVAWFGLIHGDQNGWFWPNVAVISGVGVLLTWARWRYDSIGPGILLHFSFNASQLLLYWLSQSAA